LHWPKTLDVADDGTIYVTNGGDQGESCEASRPFHGGIVKLDGSAGGAQVTKGLRNPIGVRCERGRNLCFAVELAKDYSANVGGREKLIAIRQGDDWGYPCCATKDIPYRDVTPQLDCSRVAAESGAFTIGGTPFDLDFERGNWPDPWRNRIFIPLHGAAGSWSGARLVAIATEAATGEAVLSSDLSGRSSGGMEDFATGWDDHSFRHGRPTAVAFALDGRLFLSNDTNGEIIWIAPLDLAMTN
jgi:glucose/arabinose dehydrogenase